MFISLLIASLIIIIIGCLMYWKNLTIKNIENLQTIPLISIVIPARNEEKNLPTLLNSIKEQTVQAHEVIVVDDGSTDKTVEIAKYFGAKVVSLQKNEKWKGKTLGCWEGAKLASGVLFLFMDADTWFPSSTGMKKIISAHREQGSKGMLSIQPYHVTLKKHETFSLVFNILVIVGMNVFSAVGNKINTPSGFGPFLVCTKDDYFEVGGHKAVRNSLIEGTALAKNFQEKQLPLRLYNGKNVIHFRMYPDSLQQLIEGWTKSFATGAENTHPLVMSWIVCWIAGGFLIPIFLLLTLFQQSVLWIFIGIICYLIYFLQLYVFSKRIGHFSVRLTFIYPVLFFFFVGVFARSWLATNVFKTVRWKGEEIDL